ncbi:MAG: CoB--CoM heterodisulfide reductase [Flavobacteriaceae bacterium]|nr:CoB--CoM heterodisulfide reductase [Flavobacteriaceae bacterium]|tara:strand:+ start:2148 stop:2933 length:786 start_codon:yes stop_codon:yes gene_type:complete
MKQEVPTLASLFAEGKKASVVFWVGCAGSFDDRAKKITKAFVKIMNHTKTSFAVLGTEESCTGDPAKRAGNEFLFQTQALQNITALDKYGVTKIVTTCPHCFNTLKNEYPQLGGNYKVMHHTQFLKSLIKEGILKVEGGKYKGKRITFHDPCYLGRANKIFEAPRSLIKKLDAELVEMKSCKTKGLCCGAGGAQMFKDAEVGTKEVNIERTEQALDTHPNIIAAACPFCNTMMTDGIKNQKQEDSVKIMDVAELIANANNL